MKKGGYTFKIKCHAAKATVDCFDIQLERRPRDDGELVSDWTP